MPKIFESNVVKKIPFVTVFNSAFNGKDRPVEAVIQNNDDYKSLLGEVVNSFPDVDFSTESVVVVAAGERNSSGYSVEIVSIIQDETESSLGDISIFYKETTPAIGSIVLSVLTFPIHVIRCQILAGDSIKFCKVP